MTNINIARTALAFTMLAVIARTTAADPGPMTLWYQEPAAKWVEANPLGNGRLGVMVFGGTSSERLQINEDTLWFGEPHDYAHEGAVNYLPEIRKLLFAGKQREAERLAMEQFMSVPLRQTPYQPCADLRLSLPGHESPSHYRRELNIDQAVSTIRYQVDDVTYTRQVFVSHPDELIVVRLAADKPGKLTFTATLDTPHQQSSQVAAGPRQLALRGRVRKEQSNYDKVVQDPLRFEVHVDVTADGGSCQVTDRGIEVTGADEAVLLVAAATNYVDFQDTSGDPAQRCAEAIQAAHGKTFEQLRKVHVADHQSLFRRVTLDLGTTDKVKLPTDERIKRFADGDDPQLASQYFQFGRYLLIASSRPGSQPANLQGIWNESTSPPWDSKYTVNINTEMNYWLAESGNLAECHLALFDALDEIAVTGARVAREHYGARGWVLHHNFDLWRGAAPINHSNHGIWPTGGAWLCQHLWWHYQYGGDEQFLRQRAYPLMKGAALFFMDTLVVDPRNDKGWLISGPSNSPENGGLVMGPTMDHQIIRNLFANVIQAAEVLDVDQDLSRQLGQMRARIAPNQIGQYGQLQEWLEDRDSPNNHHRHCSHLWGLHPGQEINPATPELFQAAKVSLTHRGDGGTGWSKAWKINFWARLLDGDHAYRMLESLIATGTYPNMFDAHPPFQIDGNFGGASGLIEMLLQTQLDEIAILPALPRAFPEGQVKGLRARGGLEVDITWQAGRATRVVLQAHRDGTHKLRAPAGQQIDGPEQIELEAGETYEVKFQ